MTCTQAYWLIEIPLRTKDGGCGTQTFVVVANDSSEAVQEAWVRAHTPRAEQRRKYAALTADRIELSARRFV